MKRGIFISIIVIFLIGVCTLEQILVNSTLSELKQKGNNLYAVAQNYEDVNNSEILTLSNDLRNFWQERENLLCFFINHKDMQEMGIELTHMISYSQSNIKEEFFASLQLVNYYTVTFNHIMGLSLQNLI